MNTKTPTTSQSTGRTLLPLLLILAIVGAASATTFLVWQHLEAMPKKIVNEEDVPDSGAEEEKPLPLPPFEDWIEGRWSLAETQGSIVLTPRPGKERLSVAIRVDPNRADVFIATVVDSGDSAGKDLGLVVTKDRPVIQFRLLGDSSQRGAKASYRVSKWSLVKGKPQWVTRNDYAYVDFRGKTIHGNVGTWLKD